MGCRNVYHHPLLRHCTIYKYYLLIQSAIKHIFVYFVDLVHANDSDDKDTKHEMDTRYLYFELFDLIAEFDELD